MPQDEKSRQDMPWQYQDISWLMDKLKGAAPLAAQLLPGAGLATGQKQLAQGVDDLQGGQILQGLGGLAGGTADVASEMLGPLGRGAAMAGGALGMVGQGKAAQKATLQYLMGTVPPYSPQWTQYKMQLEAMEQAGDTAGAALKASGQ